MWARSSDEFNMGYFSTGPQHSHDARMGLGLAHAVLHVFKFECKG